MAPAMQTTSLSLSARLLCYTGPPSIILLTSLASPRTGLLSPLAFVPTIIGLRAWQRAKKIDSLERGEFEPLIWTYAGTATIGIASVMIAQLAVLIATTRILVPDAGHRKAFMTEFGRATIQGLSTDEITNRVVLSSSWQNWVFNATLAFGMAGFLEEILKCLPVFYAKWRGKYTGKTPGKRAYLDYTLAGALSFGLVEGIGFLYTACEEGKEVGFKLLQSVLERLVIGSTSHLLGGALTGLRATRKDFYGEKLSWWGVIMPAVLLHGSGNFAALSFSALEGNVGWIHPSSIWYQVGLYLSVGTVNAVAAWLVRKEWKMLQTADKIAASGKRT